MGTEIKMFGRSTKRQFGLWREIGGVWAVSRSQN
jgi:hypothetical protein